MPVFAAAVKSEYLKSDKARTLALSSSGNSDSHTTPYKFKDTFLGQSKVGMLSAGYIF